MLVLADVPIEDVRSGKYSFDDLMGMIQNFYYADQFGVKFYGDAIAKKRNAALAEVEKSGAETMAQKMLVLNDWIAHNATFDMSYIMQDDKGNPIMVAQESKEHEHYKDIYKAMHELYTDQITKQFHDQIFAGIEADLRQQFYENAIWNIVYQQSLGEDGDDASDEEKQAASDKADAFMDANADAIAENPDAFVRSAFADQGDAIANQLEDQANAFIKDAEKNGVPVAKDENGNDVIMTVEQITQQTMANEKIVDLDGDGEPETTANNAIPVYAEAAAKGLTEGIIGAWEGNHIGILAEGYGVCAGYAKAFAYLLQYMSPEIYGVHEDGTDDMNVASSWKTAQDLYYDEDGNINIGKGYLVDMVRITYDADTSMFGEDSTFGEVHFWNAVRVGEEWYYVDPCYADIYVECMSRDRVEIDGTMNHMYFLFSHDTAEEMYDGNMPEDGIASLYKGEGGAHDKSYEDSWMARVATNTYSNGTNFYYMYDSTDQLSMMREFQNMQNSGPEDFNESDFEALMEGSDPTYSIVYHPITDNDVKSGGADPGFTPLVEFNYKEDEDDDTSVARVRNASGEMEENELLTELFAQYKEECDIYPSIKMTCALYNNKIYFNLSNCILSYDLDSCEIETVKVYDKVSGKRDNTVAFGGMAFSVCSESEADFTFENHPIAAMTIKEDGQMYVSVATNLGFISGKSAVNDTDHYGYAYEESNYNPDYSTYAQSFDMDDGQSESMGYSKETNDNDEFMWSAVFVDTIDMTTPCTGHTYESVTVEPTCGRDGYTENRCTKCGAVESGFRVVNEGTACEHHYVYFDETYYTKDSNGDWNKGNCYVCTICGFAIEKPSKPGENSTDEQKAEYEKELEIWTYADEHHGHTYEPTDAEWSEDSTSVTFSHLQCSSVCPKKNSTLDCLLSDETISLEFDEPVTNEEATITGHEGDCAEGVTNVYTAEGEVTVGDDTYHYTASNKVKQEAGEHSYKAEFTWTPKEDKEAVVPYDVTVGEITCGNCGKKLVGETKVDVVLSEESTPAKCEEAGENVYVATATVKDEEGTELGTVTDTKKDVVEPTGHSYVKDEENDVEHETWTWSEDHSSASLKLTCTACGEAVTVEDVQITSESTASTCTEAGTTTYTATAEYKGETYTDVQTVEGEKLGHQYEETWEWAEATEGEVPYKATLTLKCSRCDDKQTVEGTVALTNHKDVTCIEHGEDVYTATAEYDGQPYSDTKTVTYNATGHTYADDEEHAIWTWTKAEGESKTAYVATLVLKCTTCGTVTDPMDADDVTVQTTNATCTEAGTATYTAKVTHDDVEYTDVKEVTGEALGHSYQATWKWEAVEGAEIPFKATADLVCSRCEDKVEGLEAKVTQKNHKDATCTVDGETVYVANLTYENREHNSEKTVTIKATGHEWSEWGTVEEPTETTVGKAERTCSKCAEKEYKTIAMLSAPSVVYRTHVQDFGWQAEQSDGATAGTSGLSKRLEAIEIKLAANNSYTGSIEYRTHVQNIGWQDYVADGATAGTSKQSLRLEAIQIKLTGEIANYYHVYYRVHAQDYGWLDWASDDQVAGTYGLGKRLEAIEIRLVRDGDPAPGETDKPYVYRNVLYRTHVQDYGWQDAKVNGESSGTTGKSKRLEAITIGLQNQEYSGDIIYTTHIQDIGWQDKTEAAWKKNGAISGTSGQSKRLEAIRINLTGEMAKHYDVYYRVHAQGFGWMGWAKNGQAAGTAGYSYRLEAIQIQLVPKGEAAPGSTNNAFRQKK